MRTVMVMMVIIVFIVLRTQSGPLTRTIRARSKRESTAKVRVRPAKQKLKTGAGTTFAARAHNNVSQSKNDWSEPRKKGALPGMQR